MKHLLIIGARGYGREVSWMAQNCIGYGTEFSVKGFLDDKSDALDGYWGQYPPIISSVEAYEPQENDVFICALGDVRYREKYARIILEKNGRFTNLIGTTAIIHSSVKMGTGNIISNFCSLSCDVKLGDFNVMHRYVTCGHDVNIGNCCHFGAGVFVGGGVRIEDRVTLHPGCSLHPHIAVESDSNVGANSAVIRKVKAGTTVFGVPAVRLKF